MMSFVGSDTLAELVWSPQTGLAIKFAEKKPCFMWEVGPSSIGFLQSEDTKDEKHTTEVSQVASLATCHVSGEVVKSSISVELPRSTSRGQTAYLNQSSEHSIENGMASRVDGPGSNHRPPWIMETTNQCEPLECLDLEMGNAEKCSEDINSSRNCPQNDEKHGVESHKSMESCKRSNLSTKRKRRLSFEEQLILGSKRIKKQADECRVKKDSSFVNWISNMLQGLKSHENNNQRISVCEATHSFQTKKKGFQNVFQSLCSRDSKAHETLTQIEYVPVYRTKEMILANKYSYDSSDCLEIKEKEAQCLVKYTSLYERVTKEAPNGMFDTIRRLTLSRTDILKWTNSQSSVAKLDGFFLRLRVSKWEKEATGSRYYVACITGLQGEPMMKGVMQRICVKVGGVECFVESQHVSNCDFLEDELVTWWQKTSKNGGTPDVKDLKSKLAERRTLGL
uniref:uncharacterized protein LOC122600235 isoform X2 n=1 Tax=Erigeron canadensis TaxID=72917 RepID=UPI001CB90265|nr:uncharacterized protein LOC122600235 isoform X2 [Erigeron canadensis]